MQGKAFITGTGEHGSRELSWGGSVKYRGLSEAGGCRVALETVSRSRGPNGVMRAEENVVGPWHAVSFP